MGQPTHHLVLEDASFPRRAEVRAIPSVLVKQPPEQEHDMTTQHTETLVIGAGQAGLATGYHLQRLGRPFLIVDGNQRIGDNWRQQWDTLKLYSPAKYDGLPGLPFPAPPWSYPGKEEVADYLEKYAIHCDLPVRMSTRIDRLEPRPAGGFTASLGDDTLTCDNVVVATGTFGRTPNVPVFAAELDPSIQQLHSSEYRRPSQVASGPVLVVGASHSGCDIAYEVAEHQHTTLAGRDCGQIPFHWDKRAIRLGFPVLVFAWRHIVTRRTPIGRKEMNEVRHHGGPMLRVKREDLERRGVERVHSKVTGVKDGMPVLDDGRVVPARTVVWCTGFKQVFDWIDLPVFADDGWPDEYRGVVEKAPGLFFCGLSFQYSFSSMVLPGVGRDAEYVARKIAARTNSQLAA
jgi:putative flavoprotein involved in K+ transport